jgi:hypothetical protein
MKKSSRRNVRSSVRKKPLEPFPNYNVPIFKPSEAALRNDFWRGKPKRKKMKKAIREGSLGRSVDVYARSKREAAERAEAANPGWEADREAIRRFR